MGSKIFISYRRADSAATCGRIYDRLVAAFGKDAVFKDVDAIGYGADFRVAIRNALDQSAVQLVVIGPQWLDARSSQGQRRLDEANDSVRFEVEYALQRRMVVIPVLVQGASVPPPQQLPPNLQQVSYLNASQVRYDPDFEVDVRRLVGAIEHAVPGLASTAATATPAAGRVDPTPRIARQPAKLGTLLRWGVAFAAPLAFIEVILLMTVSWDVYFNHNTLAPWLIMGMVALILAGFFVIGLFVARRTGEIGSGFLTATVTAITTSLIASYTLAWADSLESTASCSQCTTSTSDRFNAEFLVWVLLFILGSTTLGIAASAIGGVIGKRISPPAVERLARSRTVLRVGVVAGLLLALADGTVAYTIPFSNGGDTSGQLWIGGIIALAALFLAGIFAGRATNSIGSGVLASLLVGVIGGMGAGFLGMWGGGVYNGTTSASGSFFIGGVGVAVLLTGLLGLISSLLPGVIGGAIGQGIRPKVAAQAGVPARQ